MTKKQTVSVKLDIGKIVRRVSRETFGTIRGTKVFKLKSENKHKKDYRYAETD